MKKTITVEIATEEIKNFLIEKGLIDPTKEEINSITLAHDGDGIRVGLSAVLTLENLTGSQKSFLDSDEKDQDMTVRLSNCLKDAGVKKMKDVLHFSIKELSTKKLFSQSKRALKELRELFETHGLKLREN